MSRAKAPGVAEVIGERVKHYRTKQGLTQADVADRTAELGNEIDRTVLARIEKGETRARNISVVDLLVLAAALDVPPPLLLLPLGEREAVAITPAITVHPHLALEWIRGDEPFVNDRHAVRPGVWAENALPITLFKDLRYFQDEAHRFDHKPPSNARTEALRELSAQIDFIEQAGLAVPTMPREWEDEIDQLRAERRRRTLHTKKARKQ